MRELLLETDDRTPPPAPAQSDDAQALDAFIARRPIFDRRTSTCAYELLFRQGFATIFAPADGAQASADVIADSDVLGGLARLADNRRAFISFTPEALIQGLAFVMSPQSLVVQIDDRLKDAARVVDACRRLKQAGYLVALDGVSPQAPASPLLALADMVRVDFTATSPADRRVLAQALGARNVALIGTRLDTVAAYGEALQAGCVYFEGRFFCEPDVLASTDVPGFKFTQLEVLRELNESELDRERVQELIRHDAVAVLKLLRYVNSAAIALRRRVDSVEQAMAILGDDALRRFLLIITVRTLSSDTPRELAVQSAIRAVFCESLAAPAGLDERAGELFLLGLFSLLAPIMRRPLRDVLDDVAITPDVKSALLGEANPLREILQCALAYESGDWDGFARRTQALGIPEGLIPARYARALEHATLLISYETAAANGSA